MGSLAAGKPVDVALALLTLVALLILFLRDANPSTPCCWVKGGPPPRHPGAVPQAAADPAHRSRGRRGGGSGRHDRFRRPGGASPGAAAGRPQPCPAAAAPALLGAALLLGADMLARTLLAPVEMPVGIITALLGAPSSSGCWSRAAGRFNRRTPLVCFIDPAALSPAQPQPGQPHTGQARPQHAGGQPHRPARPQRRRQELAAQMPHRRAGTSGEIRLFGRERQEWAGTELAHRVGVLPQSSSLNFPSCARRWWPWAGCPTANRPAGATR